MARKGQVFQQYTEEFKLAAVKAYLEGKASYKTVAEKLEIRNCTQLKVWVRKWQHGEAFDIRKGVSDPLKGRPRTAFDTVEQERDYLKAQVDYLKKRYPNLVKEARSVHFAHPYFGYPRMMTALWEAGYRVNHKKVWRLMKELSIQSVIRKKRKRSSSTPSVVYPNRLKRQFHAVGPQQKLVTDITYISDGTRFYYLSAIQDLFNNEIVAWQLSERNDVKLVLDTIEQWTRKRDVSEAVLHSDQGFQYTSQAYNSRLEAFSVKGSHSRKATCLDNACIESFFSHLKTEKLYLHQCTSEAEIHQAVEEYIYFYNYQRFQAKLKQREPIEYRHALAA